MTTGPGSPGEPGRESSPADVTIDASRVEAWADEIAKEHGFGDTTHTIDIFGLCRGCKAKG